MSKEEQFLAIGLDKKRVADTLKNEKLTATLLDVIHAATPVGAPAGVYTCDKAQGNLLYAIATESPSKAPEHLTLLAQFVGSKQLATKQQLLAAFKYLKEHASDAKIDLTEFEASCGIGVVVTRETIEECVKKAIAASAENATLGEIMKILKNDEALKWADQALVSQVVKELKPANAAAPADKKKKEAQPQQKAAAAAAAAVPAHEIPVLKDADPTTPVSSIFDCKGAEFEGKRVRFEGWVCNSREARKGLIFVDLRDGTGAVQCVFAGAKDIANHALAEAAGLLIRETSIEVAGTLKAFPEGQHASKRQARMIDYELHVDYWRGVGRSDPDIETIITHESDVARMFDYRHISLRTPKGFSILRVRSAVIHAFRCWYQEHDFVEVTPPTLVQTFCEGGSDLFKVDYFGTPAYLTQSSQLYLETVLPVVRNTYCLLPSFRAEQSRTPRHLSEFTHLETELSFINFEDLLNHLENIVCDVCKAAMDRVGDLIMALNPNFKCPQKPFKRMSYRQAIDFCNEHGILNTETGKPFVYGEDITEKPERQMTNMIGVPILMIRFPAEMKAFYMKRCEDVPGETESVDVLMPGVGEIVGGSMRISDLDELLAAYKRVGIDPSPYYWFTDQRKYGSVPHGGYGIGTERFLMWMLGIEHIRHLCLYPRYIGRCKP